MADPVRVRRRLPNERSQEIFLRSVNLQMAFRFFDRKERFSVELAMNTLNVAQKAVLGALALLTIAAPAFLILAAVFAKLIEMN